MMNKKIISALCGAALLGTTCLSPRPVVADSGMAGIQKAYTIVMAGVSIGFATVSMFTNMHGCADLFCFWLDDIKMPGIGSWNTDLASVAVDVYNLTKAGEREVKWKGLKDTYQAAVRKIGGIEEEETEDTEAMFLDETEVHVAAMENSGLPALADSSGKVLKSVDEIKGALPAIQDGFGTTSSSNSTVTLPDGSTVDTSVAAGASGVNPAGLTETELSDVQKNRREVHLQKTATAGIARSYLMRVVATSQRLFADTMKRYVGSGKSESANIKVLTGLDLGLSQRLNTLNMVQGQQVANEAADALRSIK